MANFMGFPGGSDGKESACNAGDLNLIPGLVRSPGRGHGNPLQHPCLENPHGQRSLVGYISWGRKESDTCYLAHSTWLILIVVGILSIWIACLENLMLGTRMLTNINEQGCSQQGCPSLSTPLRGDQPNEVLRLAYQLNFSSCWHLSLFIRLLVGTYSCIFKTQHGPWIWKILTNVFTLNKWLSRKWYSITFQSSDSQDVVSKLAAAASPGMSPTQAYWAFLVASQ